MRGSMQNRILLACVVVVALTSAGCGHVANPFWRTKANYAQLDKEALRAVANEIEKAVQEGNREPKLTGHAGIVVNTPEIMQILKTRAARAELVNEYRSSGFACEKRDGLLYMITNKDYRKAFKRRARDRHALLVINENKDRWTLYESIVAASKLRATALSAVQETFAEARRDLLPSGQKFQDADGKIAVRNP